MQDLQMVLEEKGDETQPCDCKNPTLLCAIAKMLPKMTVRLVLSNREHFAHYKHISYWDNMKDASD